MDKSILLADKDIEKNISDFIPDTSSIKTTVCSSNESDIYTYVRKLKVHLVILEKESMGTRLYKIVKNITRLSPTTLIFITTANGDIESYIRLINCGAYEYFHKPVNPFYFKKAVTEAFSNFNYIGNS